MYYALDLASYYLYSGDTPFAESQYQAMKNQIAYDRTLVDASGLLITSGSERDWDFYDGGKPGAVTAYNAIYYKALTDAAWLASTLASADPGNASAATWQADAATWTAQAADAQDQLQRQAVRLRARRLQARRPRQRHAPRERGAAGRQLGGDRVRARSRREPRRDPVAT